MQYDLIRPCSNCPFRSDVQPYLTYGRVKEILRSIIDRQQTFSCHKTNTFDEEGDAIESGDSKHCAGASVFLERIGRPNQMMRIAERLGLYNHKRLDMDSPVYKTEMEMLAAYRAQSR